MLVIKKILCTFVMFCQVIIYGKVMRNITTTTTTHVPSELSGRLSRNIIPGPY